MDKQEIFTKVATHLLTQMERSVSGPGETYCLYRGPNGLKCAIGCLIPDSEYRPDIEGLSARELRRGNPITTTALAYIPPLPVPWPSELDNFVGLLQKIHDYVLPESWEKSLGELASFHNLTMPTVGGQ